jgi:hypothetical protein
MGGMARADRITPGNVMRVGIIGAEPDTDIYQAYGA